MKKAIKISLMIVTILVLIIAIIISMFIFKLCPPEGPWPNPPWCASPEIGKGVATTASFFVSIPYNTPERNIYFARDGKDPIKMTKVGELSYQISINVLGQETLKYKYTTDSGSSDSFQKTITKKESKIYNGVSGWSNLDFKSNFSKDFSFGAMMFDTWGKNYNFKMFENTRDNIDSSFQRLASLGMKQVFVTDMLRVVYDDDKNFDSLDYTIEDAIFSDDFRDEALTQEDMNNLARIAHKNNLRIGCEINLGFINYGKYIGSKNISGEFAADGKRLSQDKTKEWIEDFYDKKETKWLEIAGMLKKAGFDSMFINQRSSIINKPYDSYANERLKQLIHRIKDEYGLKVNAFVFDWVPKEGYENYDYYTEADDVYMIIENIEESYSPYPGMDFKTIKEKFSQELNDFNHWAKEKKIPNLNIYFGPFSYTNAVVFKGVEFNDVLNPEISNLKPNWQEQADVYEAFLQSAEQFDFIKSVNFMLFWWDDAMDPETANTRISISSSPRNKNAEAVMMKWGNSLK